MKKCIGCGMEKELSEFYVRSGAKDGHRNDCILCSRSRNERYKSANTVNKPIYQKRYRIRHKEDIKKNREIYRSNNVEKIKEYDREYSRAHKKEKAAAGYNTDLTLKSVEHLLTNDVEHREFEGFISVKCYGCGKFYRPSMNSMRNKSAAFSGKQEGQNNLYCSAVCKRSCLTFNTVKWPKGFKPNKRELQGAWAKAVKKRDGYKCQRCGAEDDLHAHHINPLSTEYDSWLIDNGITCCAECHYQFFHKLPGCTTDELRKVCSS